MTNEPLQSAEDAREAKAFMPNEQQDNPFDAFAEDSESPPLRRAEATDDAFLEFGSEYAGDPGAMALDRIPPATPEVPALIQFEPLATFELEPVPTPELEPTTALQLTPRRTSALTTPAARYAEHAWATAKTGNRAGSNSRSLNGLAVLALGTGVALAAFGVFRALSPDEIAGPLRPIEVVDLPQSSPQDRIDSDGPGASARIEDGLGSTVAMAPGTAPNLPTIEQAPPAMPAASAAETDRTSTTLSATSQSPTSQSPTSQSAMVASTVASASGERRATPDEVAEPPVPTAVGTFSDSLALTAPPSTPEADIVERADASSALVPTASVEGLGIAAQPLAPPAATTAPVVEAARTVATSAVESILSQYSNAFTALDARQVQTIWPTVDARALDRAFDSLQRQDLDLGACDITVTGSRASASCTGSTRYVPKVGNRNVREQPRVWTFVLLQRSTGEWAIQSVHTQ